MFSGLTIWYYITNWYLLPWGRLFFLLSADLNISTYKYYYKDYIGHISVFRNTHIHKDTLRTIKEKEAMSLQSEGVHEQVWRIEEEGDSFMTISQK